VRSDMRVKSTVKLDCECLGFLQEEVLRKMWIIEHIESDTVCNATATSSIFPSHCSCKP
jgi:hypothetical protein